MVVAFVSWLFSNDVFITAGTAGIEASFEVFATQK